MPEKQQCISQSSRETIEGIMNTLLSGATPAEKNIMKDFKQEMDDLPKCGRTRGPRKPSVYNLFVKDCLTEPDIKALDTQPNRMKACAVLWNEKKKKQAK